MCSSVNVRRLRSVYESHLNKSSEAQRFECSDVINKITQDCHTYVLSRLLSASYSPLGTNISPSIATTFNRCQTQTECLAHLSCDKDDVDHLQDKFPWKPSSLGVLPLLEGVHEVEA